MQNPVLDQESESFLKLLAEQEKIRSQQIPGVRTVLVVLSARGVVYDIESLRQKIALTYRDAVIFFRTTQGKSVGVASPKNVDLLIDFTGPGQRQRWLEGKSLRRTARVAVGRNAGFFRKKIYDRVFDEKSKTARLPTGFMEKERFVQTQVLALAGVPMSQSGQVLQDAGKTIALELPSLSET